MHPHVTHSTSLVVLNRAHRQLHSAAAYVHCTTITISPTTILITCFPMSYFKTDNPQHSSSSPLHSHDSVKRARHSLVHRVAWASEVRGRVPRVPPVNAYYRRRHMCAVISERIESTGLNKDIEMEDEDRGVGTPWPLTFCCRSLASSIWSQASRSSKGTRNTTQRRPLCSWLTLSV